ncbi:Uncharacterized protein PECH_001699 [Penicillium ucsense]|uniref:Uncharacterized protein n=1 Tax=Penicillium ucsense TaxID=2839758 RepID=A0A8J8VWV9_9EURO|nr:Uncharacterized protein PECM_001547 [Penicillium ucsense]KAF7732405.1 Uncharacterized protein PECH_001699 [Penicillium ucsense]
MDFTSSGGVFPSRRSHPNLHHISLAPLTPRFPIDDEVESEDYFNSAYRSRDHEADHPFSTESRTQPRTSYLSSVSVPSTPPILSHSRSSSRTRHARSKSSTRTGPLSDTNLHSRSVALPLHHHQSAYQKPQSSLGRHQLSDASQSASAKSNAEWILRAGIALASSTREEKGQSWLAKRESSTSLVDLPSLDEATSKHSHRHHHRSKSGTLSRRSRSGASTPAARSRATSRRGSRAGLTMTTMPPLTSATDVTGTMSPQPRGRGSGLVPDFVDEQIRAEMASLQGERGLQDDEPGRFQGDDDFDSECDSLSENSEDEFDEADLQQLTRERGFGLGSWIDRLVEWTLFGVDEWPAPGATPKADANRIGSAATSTNVTFAESADVVGEAGAHSGQSVRSSSMDEDLEESLSHSDEETISSVEKLGAQGGWEDASWLLRVMKRALV